MKLLNGLQAGDYTYIPTLKIVGKLLEISDNPPDGLHNVHVIDLTDSDQQKYWVLGINCLTLDQGLIAVHYDLKRLQSIKEIIEEKLASLTKNNKRLWAFSKDVYYADLYGMFWATQQQIEKLYDKTICFGEVAGRHSEVDVDIKPGDLEDVTSKVLQEDFSLGYDLTDYLPKFDFIYIKELDIEVTPDDVDDPCEIDYNSEYSYQRLFYYQGTSYVVYAEEDFNGIVYYYARRKSSN